MIALLRYAILKSAREKFLFALLLAPSVILLSPLLAISAVSLAKGQAAYPMSFDARISPAAAARMGGEIAMAMASLAAGAGGFWIFRREMANRSVSFFLLAARPQAVAFAATIYGFLAGMTASLIVMSGLAALTLHWPASGRAFLIAMVSSLATSAMGTLLVTISSEESMLLPVFGGSCVIAVSLMSAKTPAALPAAVVAILLFAVSSSLLLRWRCPV